MPKRSTLVCSASQPSQERASKGLPGPGQHFSFGALKPWDEILSLLEDKEGEASTRLSYQSALFTSELQSHCSHNNALDCPLRELCRCLVTA